MSTTGRMNLVNFLDSTRITAIGLNHSMDHLLGQTTLVEMLKTKLVFARVTHRELVNDNLIRVVTFLFLVGCLSSVLMALRI